MAPHSSSLGNGTGMDRVLEAVKVLVDHHRILSLNLILSNANALPSRRELAGLSCRVGELFELICIILQKSKISFFTLDEPKGMGTGGNASAVGVPILELGNSIFCY